MWSRTQSLLHLVSQWEELMDARSATKRAGPRDRRWASLSSVRSSAVQRPERRSHLLPATWVTRNSNATWGRSLSVRQSVSQREQLMDLPQQRRNRLLRARSNMTWSVEQSVEQSVSQWEQLVVVQSETLWVGKRAGNKLLRRRTCRRDFAGWLAPRR